MGKDQDGIQERLLKVGRSFSLTQGFVKGEELCLISWLAAEVCWLAVEVLSPCQK